MGIVDITVRLRLYKRYYAVLDPDGTCVRTNAVKLKGHGKCAPSTSLVDATI
jgi:hypothetical protein